MLKIINNLIQQTKPNTGDKNMNDKMTNSTPAAYLNQFAAKHGFDLKFVSEAGEPGMGEEIITWSGAPEPETGAINELFVCVSEDEVRCSRDIDDDQDVSWLEAGFETNNSDSGFKDDNEWDGTIQTEEHLIACMQLIESQRS
jgi:hypothetical protein